MPVALLEDRVERGGGDGEEPVAAVGFSGSSPGFPRPWANLPRTVVTIMCLAAKITSVWVVSRFQIVVAISSACLPAVRQRSAQSLVELTQQL